MEGMHTAGSELNILGMADATDFFVEFGRLAINIGGYEILGADGKISG